MARKIVESDLIELSLFEWERHFLRSPARGRHPIGDCLERPIFTYRLDVPYHALRGWLVSDARHY
jgi:hypothetical protein